MKQLLLILIAYFIFNVNGDAQNLVKNPSFEIYVECPDDYTTEYTPKELIPGWYLPTKGTSDYFNSCSKFQVNVPNNFIGHMYARDGEAYAGIILIEKPLQDSLKKRKSDYREYVQTELHTPLLKGKSYHVKFHYAIATYSTYAVNNIGIYFSEEKINKKRTNKVLNYSPQVKANINIKKVNKDIWYEVSDTIIATGKEKFLSIGNFYSDRDTKFRELDISDIRRSLREKIERNKIAYYYIDLVSVQLIGE